ncbi:MAG: FG-GAP repeat protein [Bacteroidetes bacterium]|nr:FG-GAP repeat protein [Bacteroidota bacterium]
MRFNYTKAILSISTVVLFTGLIIPPVAEEFSWSMEGNNANSEFGFWIDGGGDVNGDGYDDVIVGAPEYTHAFA